MMGKVIALLTITAAGSIGPPTIQIQEVRIERSLCHMQPVTVEVKTGPEEWQPMKFEISCRKK